MTLDLFLSTVAALTGLTFVVASMFGTGLSLTVAQIVQPLKNARLVFVALVANFVLVASIILPLVLIPTARLLGERNKPAKPPSAATNAPASS